MPMMPRRVLAIFATLLAAEATSAADAISFARDIRPILSNACYKCHGPGTQKARLRLDQRDAALDREAFVPGKPEESAVIERITLPEGDDGRMPPLEAGHALTPAQVALLKAWIAQGANYAPHWAFVPPKRPTPPAVPKGATVRNDIDRFILAKLADAKLTPAPEADRSTLLRRVSLDLTGLLPSPRDVDAFLKDRSPNAYEKVVDRLLASPHYGERHARHWLDLARYADSNGYTIDGPRQIWPFRDWVIHALNADMPFDRFTIEQLAGDLLPKATKEQIVATGFHRNTSFNEEGGTDPEQFRVERTVDRTNTTGAVWLGLTVGCAQCHDHKYDPVSAKEYYQLYAFFNSCEEPLLPLGGVPTLEKQIADLQEKLATLRAMSDKDDEVKKTLAQLKKVQGKVPSTLVMREGRKPRATHIQLRGDFLQKGAEVEPGTFAVLHRFEPKEPTKAGKPSRLDLANWLVSPDNPLTARVTVNREWQKFFGRGLVETENDFGMQGSPPTHPALLDHLAVAFQHDDGWSLKKLHKRIVMSATYRQASHARPELQAQDPRNLLLGRQSRLRLEAEILRDAALSASGKLSRKVGGPGIYPPQPPEVFAFTQSKRAWPESQGPERYRRGMYTYIWRQAQHPLLTTFDGADAQVACTKRNRSNTPLQALHLANDPVFVELAAALGERVVKEGPADDDGRMDYAFTLCFARLPGDAERSRVRQYLAAERVKAPDAAWAALGRVLMNLDEFVTRE